MTVMPFLTPQSPLYPIKMLILIQHPSCPLVTYKFPYLILFRGRKHNAYVYPAKKNACESQWRDTRKHSHIMLLVNV